VSTRTALVAGATGAASKRLVEVLLEDPDWSVIGVARHPPESTDVRSTYLRADLLSAPDCARAFSACQRVTHVFYTARAAFGEGGVEPVEANVAMLRNVLDAIEGVAAALEHVHLVEGQKWYDVRLYPARTPAREDDPRHMPPNFYYDQEDLLRDRQSRARWTWSASRPMFIYDFSPQRARNIVSTVGAWAALCAELGLPLDFPGTPGCYAALTEMTDATQLARAISWMATAPTARNQAYNVTDNDVFRWKRLWPQIARQFGLELGEVRPLKLGNWMTDKGPIWQRIVAKHRLQPSALEDMASWAFADFCWGLDFDIVSSTTKLRRHGFHGVIDTETQFLSHLQNYRAARMLP
jgi:nucleoside-diphosphate-sugar epimerase